MTQQEQEQPTVSELFESVPTSGSSDAIIYLLRECITAVRAVERKGATVDACVVVVSCDVGGERKQETLMNDITVPQALALMDSATDSLLNDLGEYLAGQGESHAE